MHKTVKTIKLNWSNKHNLPNLMQNLHMKNMIEFKMQFTMKICENYYSLQ